MTKPEVHVIIKPMTLRFSLQDSVPVYHVGGDARTQLDQMEHLLGIDPKRDVIFDCNLGFLPICSTILIRGEKTIIVDPGNFHIGLYGIIGRALAPHGIGPDEVDMVVLTHSHLDHMATTFAFPSSELVVGEGELDAAREAFWPQFIDAFTVDRVKKVRTVRRGEALVRLCDGVHIMHTPGHTSGSLCILVESGDERVAIVGDAAMTQEEYVDRRLSHWYPPESRDQINRGLDRVANWRPTRVVPGHDAAFRVVTERGRQMARISEQGHTKEG